MGTNRLFVKINEKDNVAIALRDLCAGTEILPGVKCLEDIPQAHKIALTNIDKDGEVVRYGVVLGTAKEYTPAGSWINEHSLNLPERPCLDRLQYGTNLKSKDELPDPPITSWMGYKNKKGPAGTKNMLGIVTTVQCTAGVLKVAVDRIKKELLPKYPNVDDVVAVTHPYGCGVAINARDAAQVTLLIIGLHLVDHIRRQVLHHSTVVARHEVATVMRLYLSVQ